MVGAQDPGVRAGSQGEPPAIGYRIDSVEDQVDERFPDLAFHREDGRQVRGKLASLIALMMKC